uniref:AAA+ ATPase domain-containing protein n=1 Tax=Lophocladia kuetzingii TaxID=675577 RepID=A0A1Z1MP01_9FLOR|nr:hypothetical protein [Lophocladia kuetzingii]ARW67666.1 hypothetical protein [Lophocladia kuetzingii]
MLIADDLDELLDILPDFIRIPLEKHPNKKLLIEIVMDLGRRPEARFPYGPQYLSEINIAWHDLDFCIKKIPRFSDDNRSGIESTLHRISSIKNRKGNIIGLTFRVGRAIFGTISIIRDLLYDSKSILLLGKPGVGKTTAIREITRVLADEMEKRVVIIDTSNEIAGDGDIPHPAIGRARRMQVTKPELQHQVMIEAVENHMPEVIIIDEIGTELEASAARTIAERGVQLVGTAHGNYLESVIKNPTLSDLIGGIQYVTLGDDEAKRRGSQKSIIERKASPAFQVAIEIHHRYKWVIHEKVDLIVDQILQGTTKYIQSRKYNDDGLISIECAVSSSTDFFIHSNNLLNDKMLNMKTGYVNKSIISIKSNNRSNLLLDQNKLDDNFLPQIAKLQGLKLHNYRNNRDYQKFVTLYVYGINLPQVESIINSSKLSINLTRDILKADYILALRMHIKNNTKIRQLAKSRQIIIYTIHNSTINNIFRALRQMLRFNVISNINWHNICINKNMDEINAILEVKFAVEKIVFISRQPVELLPQVNLIRKIQCKLINMYGLNYSSYGNSNLNLIIHPY